MAIANVSGDKSEKMFEQLQCSEDFIGRIHYQLTCISVLNIILSITAILGNTLILVALHKESSLHPPSKLLFRCLATTDLGVGVIAEPLYVTYLLSVVNQRWNICRYAFISVFITSYTLGSVSLLTLTAISVDRLLALLLGMRYKQVVTLKRACMIVVTVWVFCTVFATMYFLHYFITLWFSYIALSLCLVTSILSYTRIFLTLRHQQNQVQSHLQQGQPSQTIPLNIARYRKAVNSALWVQLTLVICYLPYGISRAWLSHTEISSSVILVIHFTLSLIYLNSSLNPILYCWKIREVREAVKDTISQLSCLSI